MGKQRIRVLSCADEIARVDLVRDSAGSPVLLELEAIEPHLYLRQAPATAELLADAIVADIRGGG